MGIIIFSALSVVACVFMIYALTHFHQELRYLEEKSSSHSLIYLGSYKNELPIPQSSFRAGREQPPEDEAVVRQGNLVGKILALGGLFAPFIFAKFINLANIWHR